MHAQSDASTTFDHFLEERDIIIATEEKTTHEFFLLCFSLCKTYVERKLQEREPAKILLIVPKEVVEAQVEKITQHNPSVLQCIELAEVEQVQDVFRFLLDDYEKKSPKIVLFGFEKLIWDQTPKSQRSYINQLFAMRCQMLKNQGNWWFFNTGISNMLVKREQVANFAQRYNFTSCVDLTQCQEVQTENMNEFLIIDRLDLKQRDLVNGESEILGYHCCGIFANAMEEIGRKLSAK